MTNTACSLNENAAPMLTTEHGMPGQHEIDAQHGEGGIHTVALAPERAVEHDRRPEEHEEERRKLPHSLTPEQPHELHDRPREHDVKKDAEQFYKVQIGQGTAADERQKRQVRYIIISHRLPQRGKPAVRAEEIDPHGQKLRVVARLIIQAQPTQHERRRQQQRDKRQQRDDRAQALFLLLLLFLHGFHLSEKGHRKRSVRFWFLCFSPISATSFPNCS